jgi:release factor glutamine methyltransferase
MRIIDLINSASEHLKNRGFENSRLEVERMLGNVLGFSRLELYMEFERPLTDAERDSFRSLYRRRLSREPLQHILGTAEFREIKVKSDRRAMIPRFETEFLVETAINLLKNIPTPYITDIGTGTGVIALSIAYEIPDSKIVAIDISKEALMLAEENARKLGLLQRIEFVESNLFCGIKDYGLFDAVISNPPYIKTNEIENLQPEVRIHDPRTALDGGDDGLKIVGKIISEAGDFLKTGGMLLIEIGDEQSEKVKEIIDNTQVYSEIEILKDLADKNRIIKAVKVL